MAFVLSSFINIDRTSADSVSKATFTMSFLSASRSLKGNNVHPAQLMSVMSSLSQQGSWSKSHSEPSPMVMPPGPVMVAGTALRKVMILVVDVSSTWSIWYYIASMESRTGRSRMLSVLLLLGREDAS